MNGTLRPAFAGKAGRTLWCVCAVDHSYIVTVEDIEDGDAVCLYEETADRLILANRYTRLERPLLARSDSRRRIYVAHKAGIAILRIHRGQTCPKLHGGRILTGGGRLKSVRGLAIVSDTKLCVTASEGNSSGVYLLDRITDNVLSILQPPQGLGDRVPFGVASLSGSILLGYQSCPKLVLYTSVETTETSGTLLHIDGLESATQIAVDPAGRFLIADSDGNTVWVLSVAGEVLARVDSYSPCDASARVDSYSPCDASLSTDNTRLYIGSYNTGEISVLQ